jgi:hypothetical protein
VVRSARLAIVSLGLCGRGLEFDRLVIEGLIRGRRLGAGRKSTGHRERCHSVLHCARVQRRRCTSDIGDRRYWRGGMDTRTRCSKLPELFGCKWGRQDTNIPFSLRLLLVLCGCPCQRPKT